MKKSFLSFFILFFGGMLIFAANFQTDFNPFYFSGRPEAGTIADASYLNTPITEKERVSVGEDGHLYAGGKRIRIFGTNVSEFPPVEDAEYWAKTLASQGINCIRFHHTDSDWAGCFFKHDSSYKNFEFDESAFERFDKFFYELKKAGIYSNINLLTGRTIRPNSENKLPKELSQVADWKDRHCYGFWNQLAREEQQKYAEKILTHKNPYTGLTYAEDPAVIFVEINNENSMVKCFLDDALERFPSSLTQELDVLWTDFLSQKGYTYQSLSEQFNQNQKMGENLIAGKGNLEHHSGAKADLTEASGNAKIKVKANGGADWHVQYDLYGFTVEPDQMYTISFKAKASKNTSASVAIMMNHDPWSNLGFSKNLQLTKEWQDYSFTVAILTPDNKPRLTFGKMGLSAGTTFEFSDIKLCKGGNVTCVEKTKEGLIAFSSLDKYRAYPLELKIIATEFLCQLEADYWESMNNYLKKELGVKALTFGTALPCAPVTVMSSFDVVDSHAYWHHPSFPSTGWNTKDFYVKNQSLTTAKDGGTLANLATMRVYGKPFSVTEYDHPYPSQFSSEMMPMLAIYASLQDWDCVYSFCYELSQRNPDTQKITGYFDQASNPAKVCGAPLAARIFREFKIKPLSKGIYYKITNENELRAIAERGSAWNNVPATYFGIRPEDSIIYRTGAIVEGKTPDTFKPDDLQPVQELRIELDAKIALRNSGVTTASCDGNLMWNSSSGFFIYNDENVFVNVSMPGAKAKMAEGQKVGFTPENDFATVAGVKLDDSHWFIFSSCWSGNIGEKLYEYGTSTKSVPKNSITRDQINLRTEYSGAGRTAAALGSTGTIEVAETGWKLYPLTQDGKRGKKLKNLIISGDDKTLWYELVK